MNVPLHPSLILAAILCWAAPLSFVGCRHLDPTGPYAGDRLLYNADSLITDGHTLAEAFLGWQKRNAANLPPEVNAAADRLRLHGKDWWRAAITAREAYAASKTEAKATRLSEALAVIRVALTEAQTFLSKHLVASPKP